MTAESASPEIVVLQTGGARAEIASLGAELRQWTVAGQEMLWRPDSQVWPGVSPILFPIVGWARDGMVRVGEQTYPMGVHGFAAHSRFVIDQNDRDSVRFRLTDDEASRAVYPFPFEMSVEYVLRAESLAIEIVVANRGETIMPYACGLHPGFRWPLGDSDRTRHRIVFDADVEPFVPEITPGGLFSDRRRAVALQGRTLALGEALFAREALCWLDAKSKAITFDSGSGQALRVAAQGFRHWALWTRPPAPFLCIEAWTGHGDPEGFSGELIEKPSMILLHPGERRTHRLDFSLNVSGRA